MFNIRTDNIKNKQKFDNKSKCNRISLVDIFTANECEFYRRYQQSEKDFRRFCKPITKNQIPHFLKNLEMSNLSCDLRQKSILALKNLSSFLETLSAVDTNIKKEATKIF